MLTKSKLGQVGVGSNIAQNRSSGPFNEATSGHYLPNSHEKLTKREIMSSSSWFEHCLESLV